MFQERELAGQWLEASAAIEQEGEHRLSGRGSVSVSGKRDSTEGRIWGERVRRGCSVLSWIGFEEQGADRGYGCRCGARETRHVDAVGVQEVGSWEDSLIQAEGYGIREAGKGV